MAKYARPRSLSGTCTSNWANEVRLRPKTEGGHISPYSVYNHFITYFTTKFTLFQLGFCNLKCLTFSTLFETKEDSFWKEREKILLNQNNKQTLRENEVYRSKLASNWSTSIIYTYLVRCNATYLRFLYAKMLWNELWKALLAFNVMPIPTSVMRTMLMFVNIKYWQKPLQQQKIQWATWQRN